ncbi:hypothetical protein GOV13_01455 [Candidatus Pacearchaeota archaeon]|nr:hypothetical protein [Candidatus Pacearchaeota archaeon]
MAHLKRHKAPKRWPIPRKGTKYVVRPNFNPQRGVPLLIVFRDMLGVCQNRKEVKRAIHEKKILHNNKLATDDKNAALLFDTISVVPSKKHYRVVLSKLGKYSLEEIKESELNQKVAKIIGKKTLKGKKVQLNLRGGGNFLSEVKCNTGDSVVMSFKDKKITKCLPLKEKAKAVVFDGKHAGKHGVIEKIMLERKMAKLNVDKDDINVLIKQLMVVE